MSATDLTVETHIEEGTRWRHVKSGRLYTVIGVGRIEKDLTPVVIYQADAPHAPVMWVRPHDEFADGRFVQVED